MDYSKVIDIGSKLSLAVVLMLVLYAGSTGYWVYGSQYRELQNDRDVWKQLALKGTGIAERVAAPTMAVPGMQGILTPLPNNPEASDVKKRLDVLDSFTRYKTEPTDELIK